MLLFLISVMVLISGVVVSFWEKVQNVRVKYLSILSIVMISINMLNEMDISRGITIKQPTNPKPSFIQQSQQIVDIPFTDKLQLKSLKIFQQEDKSISKQSLMQMLEPVTEAELSLIENLNQKVSKLQSSLMYIPLDRERAQSLLIWYMNKLQPAHKQQQIDSLKVALIPNLQLPSPPDAVYHLKQISPSTYYYVIVTNIPSQQQLEYFYKLYSQKNIHLTIILTRLPHNIELLPIYKALQKPSLPTDNLDPYTQKITQYLLQQTSQSPSLLQSQIQTCRNITHLDYKLYANLISSPNKSLIQSCYQQTLNPIPPSIQCLINMITSPQQQIAYNKAKKCFINQQQPQQLIITQNGNFRLRNQHYWHNKLSPTDFPLLPPSQTDL